MSFHQIDLTMEETEILTGLSMIELIGREYHYRQEEIVIRALEAIHSRMMELSGDPLEIIKQGAEISGWEANLTMDYLHDLIIPLHSEV